MTTPTAEPASSAATPPVLPTLWLLRHGETEWSASGQYTGRTDLELTEHGREQAAAAGERLAERGVTFDLVMSSPRRRARETAALAGLGTPEIVDDAQEWDYGDYEGLCSADLRLKDPSYVLWDSGVPNGETLAEVGARADRIVERVRRELAGGGSAILVSHGHFSRILAARWLGLDPIHGRNFLLGTARLCELGWDKRDPAVVGWGL
ncbi:histidine phosphatase family protein [Falsarthrobacter nasiphocae]|uniref:Phosphoglycerate mutase n=1 Tax=Falsarthrobacter nasiphocae TaxID=189863 RepID=A0AAE4C728_9MICC|nr:histidine phosphatase family protein [Falsarthrobacter nasiphocae]MDR6892089.1 putative phosphoglycerate mutase [Falsarthrobacter nasiphocae]